MAWLLAKGTQSAVGIKARPIEECLNCKNQLAQEVAYCPVCGQKTHETKLTVLSLLSDFFGSLFNLDNGMYRSLAGLPVPGFLSKQFMSGKRKSYLNPVRLFLLTLIVHLSVLTNLVPFDLLNQSVTEYHEQLGQEKALEKFQKIQEDPSMADPSCNLDSIKQYVFEDVEVQTDSVNVFYDYKFKFRDMVDMPSDEFVGAYGLESYWERLGAQQIQRTVRDPSGAIRFGVGNLVWSVLSTIIITGLFMKLLYIRRKRFFVEHLIVLFNIHSFAFVIVSIEFLIKYFSVSETTSEEFNMTIGGLTYLMAAIFFFLSMKFYYNQGWIKSWIKFTMVGFTYIFTLFSMILLVTLISLFFFN